MRIAARGFEQSVLMQTSTQERQSICGVFSPLQQSKEIQVAFGECHSALHQSPMLSESEPVDVELMHEAQAYSSKAWLCKKAFQGLKISPHASSIHSTKNIKDTGCDQLVSDPSAHVKKRTQRQDDSILLRHMD